MRTLPSWPQLALVVAAAAVVRAWMIPLDVIPDEAVYLQRVHELLTGRLDVASPSPYVQRFTTWVPAAPFIALGGNEAWAVAAWPMIASLGQIVLAVVLGSRIAGPRAGLLAGGLLAFVPIDVVYAIHLMPDVPLAFFMGAAVVSWWLATEEGARRPRLLAAVGGLALAAAVVTRPYAGILVVFFVIDALLDRRRIPLLAAGVFGVLVASLPLLTFYAIATGNPLYRAEVVRQIYGEGTLAEPAQFALYPRTWIAPRSMIGGLGILSVVAAGIALLRPTRPHVRLLLWMGIVGGFLQFGSMSTTEFVPLLKRTRFLTPLLLPASVLVATVIVSRLGPAPLRTLRGRLQAALVMVVVGGLAILLPFASLARHDAVWQPRYEMRRAVATTIRDHPAPKVLFDHWRTAILVAPFIDFGGGDGFYRGFDDSVRMQPGHARVDDRYGYLVGYQGRSVPPGSLVIVDVGNAAYDGPGAVDPASPPSSWSVHSRHGDTTIFEVDVGVDSPE